MRIYFLAWSPPLSLMYKMKSKYEKPLHILDGHLPLPPMVLLECRFFHIWFPFLKESHERKNLSEIWNKDTLLVWDTGFLFEIRFPCFQFARGAKPSFWSPGVPEGVLSNRPCPWSILKYIRERSLVFLKFCMKLGINKEKDSWKKSWYGD